jgi:hypothetical protein
VDIQRYAPSSSASSLCQREDGPTTTGAASADHRREGSAHISIIIIQRSRKTTLFRFLNLLQTSSAAIVAASVTVFAASANAEAQVDYVVGTVQYQTHRRSSVLKPSVTLLLLLLRD